MPPCRIHNRLSITRRPGLSTKQRRKFSDAQACEPAAGPNNEKITSPDQLEMLQIRTFYGREKDNAICPIALIKAKYREVEKVLAALSARRE